MSDRSRWRIGLVPAVVAIALPWLATTGSAQTDDDLKLTLLDHSFSVPADGTLSLSYEVVGRLPPGVVPTTTTTTTTRPPTTTTTTTTASGPQDPTDGGDAEPAPAPPAPSTTTRPPTTTTVPDIDGRARVLVYPALTDPSQVAAALAGDITGLGEARDGLDLELDETLETSGRGRDRTVSLDIEAPITAGVSDADDLSMPDAGVYPVETLLRLDDETVARHLTLVRREPDTAAASVNLAVLGGVFDATTATSGLARLIELGELDAPVTAAVPPDLLADVSGTAPELIEDLSAALANDEIVALPQDGLDVSSAATADLELAFTSHLRAGEDALSELLPRTPVRRSVWPIAADPPSVDGANLLAQLGVRTFVLSPSIATTYVQPGAADPGSGGAVRALLPDGDVDATVVDPTVAALLEDPGDRAARDVAMEVLSTLTIQHADPTTRLSTVLTTSELGPPDPDVIAALIDLAADTDDIDFSSASALPSQPSSAVPDNVLGFPESAGVDLKPRVDLVNLTSLQLSDTMSMLPDDDARRTRWREELDALLSTDVTDDEARQTVDELLAESEALRSSIVAPEPFTFTMTGRSSDIRVRITNDADTPLSVRVSAVSPKLTFPDGAQTVELAPRATTLVPISVVARSNGTSELVVLINTVGGDELTDPVHLTANVRSFTGLSQLVTGGAALVLLTWWITHLRRRRLERRLAVEAARHPSNGAGGT